MERTDGSIGENQIPNIEDEKVKKGRHDEQTENNSQLLQKWIKSNWIQNKENEWITKKMIAYLPPDLRPAQVLVNKEESLVTVIYSVDGDREKLKAKFVSCLVADGDFKKEDIALADGLKTIRNLGAIVPGSLKGWHGSSTGLPPVVRTESYCCKHKDLNHRHPDRTGNIKTHIRKDGRCGLTGHVRILQHEVKTAKVTYEWLAVTLARCDCSCNERIRNMKPLTSAERAFLIRAMLKYESNKAIWEKVIVPMINSQDPLAFSVSRLLKMTEPELNKFAKQQGLDKRVRPGKEDFIATKDLVNELRGKGVFAAIKLPGEDPNSCDSVPLEARQYLNKNDLFLMIMTPVQVKLLQKYGTCIGTDGTHSTLSYNKLKVVTVNVTSFDNDPQVTERGFPVSLIITSSEREEIHKAIVACIRSLLPVSWKPQLLMSDMAFGAFNAWAYFFPSLVWMWCVFHVWQAWHKKISQTPRPVDMSQEDWSHLKGLLIKEVKSLISPPKDCELSWEEFDKRADIFRKVLWSKKLVALAESFEVYLSRKDKWAPPARRQAVDTAFGIGSPMPMLAVSNNSVERFFGVLKYILLGGKCALTMRRLLDMWIMHEARIKVNVINAGISLRALMEDDQADVRITVSTEADVGALEDIDDETLEQEFGEEHKDATILDVDDSNNCELLACISPSEPLQTDQNDCAISNKSSTDAEPVENLAFDSSRAQTFFSKLTALEEALSAVRRWASENDHEFFNAKTTLAGEFSKMTTNIRIALTLEPAPDVAPLGDIQVRPFIKQANNFGNTIVTDEIVAASQSVLYKKKRARDPKLEPNPLQLETETFSNFVKLIVNAPDFESSVEKARKDASSLDYYVLRLLLRKISVDRMRALAVRVFGKVTPKSIRKADMVNVIIAEVCRTFNFPSDLESVVGDFGILTSNQGQELFKNEIVCLKLNATCNMGDPCVTRCDNMIGWVVRESKCVEIEVEESRMVWGKLEIGKGQDIKDVL
jgi:hypothetical protein